MWTPLSPISLSQACLLDIPPDTPLSPVPGLGPESEERLGWGGVAGLSVSLASREASPGGSLLWSPSATRPPAPTGLAAVSHLPAGDGCVRCWGRTLGSVGGLLGCGRRGHADANGAGDPAPGGSCPPGFPGHRRLGGRRVLLGACA